MTAMIVNNARVASRIYSRGVNWERYALVGLAAIFAANVANLLVYALGGALVAYDPQFPPLANPSGTIFFTVIPAVGAVLLYAPIRRFARRPALIFGIIAAIVLAVSIVPDLTYIPTVPGATNGQTAILILMHIVAAGVITGMLTRLNAPRELLARKVPRKGAPRYSARRPFLFAGRSPATSATTPASSATVAPPPTPT